MSHPSNIAPGDDGLAQSDVGGTEKTATGVSTAPDAGADSARQSESFGVRRVEALAGVLTTWNRVFIFLGVFLVAYAYGLDGTLRYAYQPTATGSFDEHSLTSTINVLRAVIAAAAQPTSAKIADVFGRVELIIASVVFYVLGTMVQAVAQNIATFAAGTVIYQVGYTMIMLLVEVIIADITSTRARLFFSYIPALPFIINTWVSGDIASAVLTSTTWRWGIGMWCIIYTVCTLPLIVSLLVVSRSARQKGLLDAYRSPFQALDARDALDFAVKLFHRLDVIGILLLLAVFALILVPLTLAGGLSSEWNEPRTIVPLVFGVLSVPLFIFWELKARHPLVPFQLMKDRGVWAPICIAILLNFAWTMQGGFLYTVLIVAFDFSITSATRITSLYSFTSVIVGPILGLIVFKVRRLKIFILAGTSLFMVAFGLLIHYRGSTSATSGQAGVIAAQVVLGVAGGMFPYPAQASLQVGLQHENLAVMTGVYLAMYNIGSALGSTVSGAIWTQTLPSALESRLSNPDLVAAIYGDPLTVATQYPMGSDVRVAIVGAYRSTQRLLTITGICLCIPLIGFAAALRNPKLNDRQTLAKTEEDSDVDVVPVAQSRA
jgi:MFS transporter, SIT family, siderophore-iron:H+ symporter